MSDDPIALSESEAKELLDTYLYVRELNCGLNEKLVAFLPTSALTASSKKLGLSKDKAKGLENEGIRSVLVDYCIYHHQIKDKSILDLYEAENIEDLSDDEIALLGQMKESLFCLLQVQVVLSYGRIIAKDLLTGHELLFMDQGLSAVVKTGLIIVSMIIDLPMFAMSTGAPLLITDTKELLAIEHIISAKAKKNVGLYFDQYPKGEQAEAIADVLKVALKGLEDVDGEGEDGGKGKGKSKGKGKIESGSGCGEGCKHHHH